MSHVLFETGPTGLVATGVAFVHNEVPHVVKATKDVIISAGFVYLFIIPSLLIYSCL